MKGFDVKKIMDAVTDKNALMAIVTVIIYQVFVASRITNKYLSNASVILVPALFSGFISKDKQMASKMVLAGLAVGGVAFIKDLLSAMINAETNPQKKAQLTSWLTALNGSSPQTVGAVSFPVQIQGRTMQGEYIPPERVKRQARETNGGAY
jgi:hypothetical protein